MKRWLWDNYRLTPKCANNNGKWAIVLLLDPLEILRTILYIMKFPGTACGRSLSKSRWRQWLHDMRCDCTAYVPVKQF